jgi:FkbM family methyltransferase
MPNNTFFNLRDGRSSLEDNIGNLTKTIVFGCGASGRQAVDLLREKGVEVLFFVDNNLERHGNSVEGIRVLSPNRLNDFKDVPIVIASDWAREIAGQLSKLNRSDYISLSSICLEFDRWKSHFESALLESASDKTNLLSHHFGDSHSRRVLESVLRFRRSADPLWLELSHHEQYRHPLVRVTPGETVIDGGAWEGDTTLQFVDEAAPGGEVYAIEASRSSIESIEKLVGKRDLPVSVYPVRMALWDRNRTLRLKTSHPHSGHWGVDPEGSEEVPATELDSLVEDLGIRVGLLKLDVEGAEIPALKGAVRTLQNQKPKLQVCVYHKPDDLWEIPLLIHQIEPGYQFFLGHHRQGLFETVLYAKCSGEV